MRLDSQHSSIDSHSLFLPVIVTMSRVVIYNQLGIRKLWVGPMHISHEPTGFKNDNIPDWDELCDDVNEVLKAATSQTRLFKHGTMLLFLLFTIAFIAFSQTELMIDLYYFGIIVASIIFLTITLYFMVMRRIQQVMDKLSILLKSRVSTNNRIRYELQEDSPVPALIKRFYIVVHGADVDRNGTSKEAESSSRTLPQNLETNSSIRTRNSMIVDTVTLPSALTEAGSSSRTLPQNLETTSSIRTMNSMIVDTVTLPSYSIEDAEFSNRGYSTTTKRDQLARTSSTTNRDQLTRTNSLFDSVSITTKRDQWTRTHSLVDSSPETTKRDQLTRTPSLFDQLNSTV